MKEAQEDLIVNLEEKIKLILSMYEKTNEEKNHLVEKEVELMKLVEEKDKRISELESKYNVLKVAKSLLATSDNPQEAKKKINGIVREIDKCIALLNI